MKLAEQVVGELHRKNARRYPLYERILIHAFNVNAPVFSDDRFSRRYEQLAADGQWFANQLVANACLEGYGSEQIWKFSNRLDNDHFAEKVRFHALDESRHASMFVTALKLTFPGLLEGEDSETQVRIEQMQPRYSQSRHPPIEKAPEHQRLFEKESINELIQVHITEIRALVLQYVVRQALIKHAPDQSHSRLVRISDRLISDEIRHIDYSAEIFEHYASRDGNADYFFQCFEDRLRDFNLMTQEELDREGVTL
jgi:hypothetical protein